MNKRILCVVAFVLLFAVVACSKLALYQNLSEDQANEILVLLSENGIKATKKRVVLQNEASYSVDVREADMPKARQLLVQHNIPRRKELGLAGVYEDKSGFLQSPDEQKARSLLALKGEIINSLERIPQIVDADVVLNVPTKDEFADADKQKQLRPTASVIVKVRPDAVSAEAVTEAKIQQFVANAVEGLNPRDVSVIISYVGIDEKTLKPGDVKTIGSSAMPSAGLPGERPDSITLPKKPSQEIMGIKIDPESKGRFKVYILVFFLLLVLLATALIVVIVQGSRARRELAARGGPAGEHPAIEGQVVNEGPPRLKDGG